MRPILALLLLLLVGCGHPKPSHGNYSIGRDPSWFPLRIGEKGAELVAFTNALVQKIAEKEDVPMHIVNVSWIQLFQGLEEHEYAGALSSLPPSPISLSKYAFSDPIIRLGPVLVVQENTPYTTLEEMDGMVVGIDQFGDAVNLVQQNPTLLIVMYQNMNVALEDLEKGTIDAVLLPNLEAQTLIPARYRGVLKIISEPLTDKALRLLTLKDEESDLLRHFNNGLRNLQQSSEYTMLLQEFFLLLNNYSSR